MRLAKECWGCARILGGRCRAITYPREMWRDGECWARTEDKRAVEREEADIRAYQRMMAGQGGDVA